MTKKNSYGLVLNIFWTQEHQKQLRTQFNLVFLFFHFYLKTIHSLNNLYDLCYSMSTHPTSSSTNLIIAKNEFK